jgi:D-cysteine desulfhydrase family pyridoxal phosphate-dependent enzyme
MNELARFPLAFLPTPVTPLPNLTTELNGPQLWIKRDDQTGLALGGNKTRKLEYLVGQAKQEGAQMLITAGAIQSNHCRQTAAAARVAGMECVLVLAGDEPKIPTGNTFLDVLMGAELVWSTFETRARILEETFLIMEADGHKPFLIPYGGSNPVGAAGYVVAMQELMAQNVSPDWVVFATSSGGTHAGLVVGKTITKYAGNLLGISIDESADPFKKKVADLATETAQKYNLENNYQAEEILVNDDYLGEGYAIMGEPEKEAIHLFARHEGILLDPVYTGRAAAGMIDLIRKGQFSKNENVLFWHTGGAPALFSEQYRIELVA